MRYDRELSVTSPCATQCVSPNPTFHTSLEYVRSKLGIASDRSHRYLFFVAFCLGSNLHAYPAEAEDWCALNYDRYARAGWTPDFFYAACGASAERVQKLSEYDYKQERVCRGYG